MKKIVCLSVIGMLFISSPAYAQHPKTVKYPTGSALARAL